MACLETYDPLGVLKPVAESVWIVDGPVIDMAYVVGSLPFTTRTTVIRLADGGLWVHSPTPLTDDLAAQLDALGPVRWLVAPNKLHFWWLPDWKARYPEARVCAAPGVRDRAKDRLPADAGELDDALPSPWGGEIELILVRGGYMTEAEFHHVPSRTLVLTDLIENFEPAKTTCWRIKLLMKLGGVMDPGGSTPYDLRATFFGRRDHLRRAVHTMLAWSPRRVLLAHGRCYLDDAESELKRALKWML